MGLEIASIVLCLDNVTKYLLGYFRIWEDVG